MELSLSLLVILRAPQLDAGALSWDIPFLRVSLFALKASRLVTKPLPLIGRAFNVGCDLSGYE